MATVLYLRIDYTPSVQSTGGPSVLHCLESILIPEIVYPVDKPNARFYFHCNQKMETIKRGGYGGYG